MPGPAGMSQSLGGPFANYMAAAAVAANRKHFEGPGSPLMPSPAAAGMAAASMAAAAAAAARFPTYLGNPMQGPPYMPPSYRHPLFQNFPGLGTPYHPSAAASFHSLLAGLSAQQRPKLGDFPADYQSLLAAVSNHHNNSSAVSPSSKSSPSPPSPSSGAPTTATGTNGSSPPPKQESPDVVDRRADSIALLRNKAREHEQTLIEADGQNSEV
jgi:hypothetical protein